MRKIYAKRGRRGFPGYRGRGFIVSRRHQTFGRSRPNYGYEPTTGPIANGCALLMVLGIVGIVIWIINIASQVHLAPVGNY